MMTEDEAKTKRCCGATGCGEGRAVQGTMNAAGEISPDYLEKRFCIGSACMAWQWERRVISIAEPPGTFAWVDERTTGHCGLAGRP